MDAGAKQRLADVDIAKTGDDSLVEQQELDRRACVRRGGRLSSGASRSNGSGPSAANGGQSSSSSVAHQVERAEPARVVERQPPALVGLDQEMVVLADLAGSIRQWPDMPRWKTNVSPRSVSIRPYLARRPKPGDPRAGQPLAEVDRQCPAQIGPARLDPLDPPAVEHIAQGRGQWFRLREARASRRYGGAAASPLEAQRHGEQVNFGDELVSPEEKTRRVGAVFSSVARATM